MISERSMKYGIFCMFIGLTLLAKGQQTKQVLFLGNSYTYYNTMPAMVEDIARSFGDSVYQESHTPGGYHLQGHSTNATSLTKIKSRNWDYVILQDQSQRPSFDSTTVHFYTFPYAENLCDSIRANDSCTQPMFFMTWGRENGDASNCPNYPPSCTYSGMQSRLRDNYLIMGRENNTPVAPVGAVWREVRQADSTLSLYTSDGSHPNVAGSYLAACTFYSSTFHQSPVGGWKPASLDSTDAYLIQQTAAKTVFDSLNVWRIDTALPFAHFNWVTTVVTSSTVTVVFDEKFSRNADSLHWNFGDGNTSSASMPSNIYTLNAQYVVTLEVWKGCDLSIFKDTIVFPMNIDEFNQHFKLYPNPTQNQLRVESSYPLQGRTKYTIYSVKGEAIISDHELNNLIDVSLMRDGIYILQLNVDGKTYHTKFMKE